MLQPGSVLSRTLAVALLGIAVLGAYRLIVAPLLTAYRDGEARIEQAKTCSSVMRLWPSNALC